MTFIFWLQFATVCVAGAMSPGPSLALIIRKFSDIKINIKSQKIEVVMK